jgi:hypothetical protein
MARGLNSFAGRVLLILSGGDYTAKEFLEYVATAEGWRGVLERPNLTRVDVAGADHTFASSAWRNEVAVTCVKWIRLSLKRRSVA